MSAFPTRKAGSPLAGQRAGLLDWHIGCNGCTGSAPHTRERRHLLSGALELGLCSRLETPNARAGRWCDRIRRRSDSGKGPVSDVPLASVIRAGSQRPENPRLCFFSLFAARFSCRDFCGFFFASRLRSKPLLMACSPGTVHNPARSATRDTAPCALPCRRANVHGPKGEQCRRKTSTLEAARNLSACLSRPRRTPALSPGQSLTS